LGAAAIADDKNTTHAKIITPPNNFFIKTPLNDNIEVFLKGYIAEKQKFVKQ
jgi:hypothetical protein